MSIRPQWIAKILNGEKTIEIRKLFPKDYVGWIYLYCTKEKSLIYTDGTDGKGDYVDYKYYVSYKGDKNDIGSGKVVARFWCDKVKGVWKTTTNIWTYGSDLEPNFYKESCLNDIELNRYFKPTKAGFNKVYGYAIHITKLEIFDEPKELYDFKVSRPFTYTNGLKSFLYYPLTKAPESYCYVEVENE